MAFCKPGIFQDNNELMIKVAGFRTSLLRLSRSAVRQVMCEADIPDHCYNMIADKGNWWQQFRNGSYAALC